MLLKNFKNSQGNISAGVSFLSKLQPQKLKKFTRKHLWQSLYLNKIAGWRHIINMKPLIHLYFFITLLITTSKLPSPFTQSALKENCYSSRTSDDIDMKLGPVTKLDKKNKTLSKKFDNDVMSAGQSSTASYGDG